MAEMIALLRINRLEHVSLTHLLLSVVAWASAVVVHLNQTASDYDGNTADSLHRSAMRNLLSRGPFGGSEQGSRSHCRSPHHRTRTTAPISSHLEYCAVLPVAYFTHFQPAAGVN